MTRPNRRGAKQNPVYSMWLLVFCEAALLKAVFHRSPREAPAATFFWKDYNFKIKQIILGGSFL